MSESFPEISLSIREFALPTPRVGSIEPNSGFHRAAQEGIEIHQRVQQQRSRIFSSYQSEVKISHEILWNGFRFLISGRMDGFYDLSPPQIEEIKTTSQVRDLKKKIEDLRFDHPYFLQLQTYGYFYWAKNQILPQLTFELISTRSSETESFSVGFEPTLYEGWFHRRLDELVEEAKRVEKRIQRRKRLAAELTFPFETPRSGQSELIQTLEQAMSSPTRMLLQAPTGLGKTVGVLYPSLKQALSRGQGVSYVTPKNSQHAVAEDALDRFQEQGVSLKSLTLTAKSKICFKNEPICNPDYCEYAKDYYTKLHQNQLTSVLARKRKLSAKTFQDLGEEYQVCPFQLQLEAIPEVDVMICDYNYVFSPRGLLREGITGSGVGSSFGQQGKPNLVIDEAHNLPSRGMDYYSPSLSSVVLEKMREEVRELPQRFRADAELLLDSAIQVILDCKPTAQSPERSQPVRIELSADGFLEQDSRLKVFLSRYLDSVAEVQPKDVILRLCFYWAEFTSMIELLNDTQRKEFFATYHPNPTGGMVRITCCDASELLKPCYDEYENVIAFSATLKPFDFYARLSGFELQTTQKAEFHSPFLRRNRKVLIIPQVSTKYSDREKNYAKIADAIRRIAALKSGNYFAFFPSFDFLRRVLECFQAPEGFTLLQQEREMSASAVNGVLELLKCGDRPTLVFAVQGGVFSEGVDYPGQMLIGAFVIGPPLPGFDLEREEMKQYYDTHYRSGFDFAYAFPAMAKAVQAAGRVIRTESDRGLIVLMDARFLHSSYIQSMPKDWYDQHPRELVSEQILKEVQEFWSDSSSSELEA